MPGDSRGEQEITGKTGIIKCASVVFLKIGQLIAGVRRKSKGKYELPNIHSTV